MHARDDKQPAKVCLNLCAVLCVWMRRDLGAKLVVERYHGLLSRISLTAQKYRQFFHIRNIILCRT